VKRLRSNCPLRRKNSGRIVEDYVFLCIYASRRDVLISADEQAQTNESRTWRPPLPRPAGGPHAAEAARRVARAGRAANRGQHPSSLRARHGRSLPWCGKLTFQAPARHRAPNREPGRILIPGDGAARDQGAQNSLPARRWRLLDACGLSRLNDFLAL
jgi:hypothetical protein